MKDIGKIPDLQSAVVFWLTAAVIAVFTVVALFEPLNALFRSAFSPYVVFDVGISYWSQPQSLKLLMSGTSGSTLVATLMYCLIALLIGRKFLESFTTTLGQTACDRVLLWLAGFMPGYLLLVAINRLVTLILPNHWAFPALLVLYLTMIELELFNRYIARKTVGKDIVPRIRKSWATVSGVVALLAMFLIYQVQTGGTYIIHSHVVGDAAGFYLHMIQTGQGFGDAQHFPMITRHYDEIMFLYPLIKWQMAVDAVPHLEWYWVVYGFGKAACFALVTLSVAALSHSRWLGVLVAGMLFFGGIHPNPLAAFLIFDSANPLASCLHIARVFLAVLPIVIVALAARHDHWLAGNRPAPAIVLLLLGISLSSLSINVVPLVCMSAAMALLAMKAPPVWISAAIGGLLILATSALYASIAPYKVGEVHYFLLGLYLLGGCIVAIGAIGARRAAYPVLAALHRVRQHEKDDGTALLENSLTLGALVFIGIAGGLIFLGNIIVMKVYTALHVSGLEFVPGDPVMAPTKFGVNPWCGTFPIYYCDGLYAFAKFYGLPFILVSIGLLMALRRPPFVAGISLAWASAIALTMLALSFFAIDFMNGDPYYSSGVTMIWLKTRLSEPWFYGSIALGIVTIWNHASLRARPFIISLLLIFILLRHGLSEKFGMIGQLMVNARYLAEHLF